MSTGSLLHVRKNGVPPAMRWRARKPLHAARFDVPAVLFVLMFAGKHKAVPVLCVSPVRVVWRCSSLAEVRVQEGEPLENALRRFKRKVQQEDIIKEVKRHSFYLKPGEKRRVKQALARKRNRKKVRKEQD